MARNVDARFVRRVPDALVRRPAYELIEEYHLVQNDEELALYGIVKNMAYNQVSWDLHYDMRIGETGVHIQETNTEFVKKIQQLIYDRYTRKK